MKGSKYNTKRVIRVRCTLYVVRFTLYVIRYMLYVIRSKCKTLIWLSKVIYKKPG